MRLVRALNALRLRSRSGRIFCPTASLSSVITTLTHFRGADPKDAIYAVRSLASIEEHVPDTPSLKPEYNQSVLDLYTDSVMHCVRTSKSLDIILRPWAPVKRTKWGGKVLDPTLLYNVPSWIAVLGNLPYGDPNLDLQVRQNADSFLGPLTRPNFHSHGSKPAHVIFGMDDATRKPTGSLFAQGIVLGTIERASPRMGEGTVSKENLELLGGIERSADGTLQSIDDAAWQVLCANIGLAGAPAPSLYRTAFLGLLQTGPDVQSIDTGELLREDSSVLVGFEKDFLAQVQTVCWNRRIFRARAIDGSGDELVGLAPRAAQRGDTLAILYGCSVPVVMRAHRKESGDTQWELVGEAYVHCQMNGEALCAMTAEHLSSAETMFEIR